MEVETKGSDLERRLRSSTNLGQQLLFLTSTATRTKTYTDSFMIFIFLGSLGSGGCTRLHQELINTNQTDAVGGWDVLNGKIVMTHHENCALNRFDEQVLLAIRSVIKTLNADLKTGLDDAGGDTTEGIKTTLFRGGYHFRGIQHETCLEVTVSDTNASLIIRRIFVQSLGTILLGGNGRRKVHGDHLY